MKKLSMHTSDLTQKNIEALAQIFPNCITEREDENGVPEKAIDWELLRQELSAEIVEGPQERYQLNWPGKRKALRTANVPIAKTLRPCREESVDFENTQNIFIEGDNLDALKILQETYLGKVKMIYIDPPYNTGKDFVYSDRFVEPADEYLRESGQKDDDGNRLITNTDSNGRYHSDWLSMMYPRLKLARNLLRDDGVIFISIDYHENFNCRTILNEVFGEDNFIGEIYWESKTKSQNTITSYNKLQPKAEMILIYTKQTKRRFNLITKGAKNYPLSDENGVYREYPLEVMNASGIRGRETMIFDVSDGNITVSPPEGKQWKLGQDQVAMYKNNGNLFIRDGKVIIKMRPDFERSESTEPFWGFFPKEMGTAESAKKELTEILGKHGFETVKPIDVIKRFILHATENNDIIIDFFAGSGTTAHAVMQLNAEDGGNRKYIMVQIDEKTDENSEAFKAGYKNIAEISKERIRRAGKKIREDFADKLADREKPLDTGFRVFKVAESNMKEVFYHPDEISQSLLSSLESNIKEDRTPADLLTQVMLELGITLDLPIEEKKIKGHSVFFVAHNALVACFDTKVDFSIVDEIAQIKPLKVVFRDSSFADDKDRINVETRFKRLSPDTQITVL